MVSQKTPSDHLYQVEAYTAEENTVAEEELRRSQIGTASMYPPLKNSRLLQSNQIEGEENMNMRSIGTTSTPKPRK